MSLLTKAEWGGAVHCTVISTGKWRHCGIRICYPLLMFGVLESGASPTTRRPAFFRHPVVSRVTLGNILSSPVILLQITGFGHQNFFLCSHKPLCGYRCSAGESLPLRSLAKHRFTILLPPFLAVLSSPSKICSCARSKLCFLARHPALVA